MRGKAAQRAKLKAEIAAREAETRAKFIKVTDDWYPCHPGNTVEVKFRQLTDRQWRVSAWGADDFGMERDFPHVERQEAKALFEKLVDGMSQADMRALGMINS
jgi:hypothetical protein